MWWKYLIAVCGTIGLAGAALLAGRHVVRRGKPAGPAVLFVVPAVLVVNGGALAAMIAADGVTDALRESFAAGLLLASLIAMISFFGRRSPALRGLDAVLLLLAAVVQFGATFQIGRPGVAVDYKPWFVSHQVAFVLGAACFAAAGAAGAVYLFITELLRRKRRLALLGRLPPLESLERFGRWMLVLGFPALSYGVLTGFCYLSRQPNRSEWLRDPFILVTLLLWAVYAVAVFAVWFLPRMRGRRGATLATVGLGILIIVFVVMGHVSTLHR